MLQEFSDFDETKPFIKIIIHVGQAAYFATLQVKAVVKKMQMNHIPAALQQLSEQRVRGLKPCIS